MRTRLSRTLAAIWGHAWPDTAANVARACESRASAAASVGLSASARVASAVSVSSPKRSHQAPLGAASLGELCRNGSSTFQATGISGFGG